MSITIEKELQPEFKYFRLDFKIMVVLIYQLIGKDNFISIFRTQYPNFQSAYFDIIYYETFLRILEEAFRGLQCNIQFTCPSTQTPQLDQPADLHDVLT